MKKIQKFSLLALLFVSFLYFYSCKKDSTTPTPTPTPTASSTPEQGVPLLYVGVVAAIIAVATIVALLVLNLVRKSPKL